VERCRYCYQSDLATPMAARQDALAVARAWGIENLSERLRMLTTESVTNAVRHAGGPIEMELRWDPPTLRAAVSDGTAAPPTLSERPLGEGGLGLHMIDEVADAWGVDFGPNGGKTVWFLLRSM
jgi:anti-sigma regulatory factor (Ser/Thr protein kinase)